ncbi:HNH endonuclease signature motif containing protein [Microcoleus sp. herbarium19]|uniref:HNH endonuclease n=1 Tax=unclassified Microcoleus TaxID=2642155 RepID=UPI002FD4786C
MAVSEQVKAIIRAQAQNRCGYCRSLQMYVLGILELDHIIPKAVGGTDNEENLCLACSLCNNYKGIQTDALDPVTQTRVTLFNPRTQQWSEHFVWSEEGTEIRGVTDCDRATVTALQLNNNIAVTVRRQWVSAGWHPPRE